MRNRKIKNLITISSALAVFALSSFWILALRPGTAEAHVLQTDGSIGAVLHIDPDDDPIIGKPATFFFDFVDRQKKFDPAKCDCTVNILDDQGKVLVTNPLFQASGQSGLSYPLFSYTFAQKGVYTIEALGQPKNPGDFQSFNLKYPLRVTRTDSPAAAQLGKDFFSSHWFHLGLFVFGFLIIWLWSFLEKFKDKPKNKKQQNSHSTALKSVAFAALFGLSLHTALLCHAAEFSSQGLINNTLAAAQLPCCTQTQATLPALASVIMPATRIEHLPLKKLSLSAHAPDNLINNKSPPIFFGLAA